jgi:type I restriction enzyme M protein
MDPALMLLPGATNPVTTPSATPIAAISNYLLQCLATHKSLGEKVTPPEIGQLLAALLPPTPGQRIYDPACGLGSLLLALAGVVNSRNFALYGQEQDFRFQTLCRLNMIFHGCDSARIEGGNSLLQPKFVVADQLKKFDLVVSNPGFSREAWGADNAAEDRFRRFYRGVPPPTRADYAIISHMLATLSDPGRMAVVVPHGALFRGGAESKIRQTLIAENLLDAVIGLPAHLCYHSPIPVVVLLFKRGRLHSNVLFIDASRDFAHDKPQHRLRTRDISRIVKTYQEFQTVAGYACRATVAQIQENDCNLSISRYVAADTSLPTLDLASLQQEIAILEAELASVCAEIDQCGQALAQARVTR